MAVTFDLVDSSLSDSARHLLEALRVALKQAQRWPSSGG
jgi:hypothetical protein